VIAVAVDCSPEVVVRSPEICVNSVLQLGLQAAVVALARCRSKEDVEIDHGNKERKVVDVAHRICAWRVLHQ
jgi:hypothetical protein